MRTFGLNVLGNSKGALLHSASLRARLVWSEVLPLSSPKEQRIHNQSGAEMLHSVGRAQRLHRNAPAKLHRWQSPEPVPAPEGTWTCLTKPGKTGAHRHSETETPAGQEGTDLPKIPSFWRLPRRKFNYFMWQHSIRRTFSVSGSPEKQDNQRIHPGCTGWQSLCRKGLDPTGAPDLPVEPQGTAGVWAGNYRDRQLNLGKMHLVPQLPGNLIPSFLQDSSL